MCAGTNQLRPEESQKLGSPAIGGKDDHLGYLNMGRLRIAWGRL